MIVTLIFARPLGAGSSRATRAHRQARHLMSQFRCRRTEVPPPIAGACRSEITALVTKHPLHRLRRLARPCTAISLAVSAISNMPQSGRRAAPGATRCKSPPTSRALNRHRVLQPPCPFPAITSMSASRTPVRSASGRRRHAGVRLTCIFAVFFIVEAGDAYVQVRSVSDVRPAASTHDGDLVDEQENESGGSDSNRCPIETGEITNDRQRKRNGGEQRASDVWSDLSDDKGVPMQVLKPEILTRANERSRARERQWKPEQASVPMVESWFRPATEGPRRFRASPRSIQGSAPEKPLLRTRRDRRREPKNRAEHPTRSSNCAWPQHAQSGRLQQTAETSRRNSAAPSPSRPATPVNAGTASSRELAVQT